MIYVTNPCVKISELVNKLFYLTPITTFADCFLFSFRHKKAAASSMPGTEEKLKFGYEILFYLLNHFLLCFLIKL